MKPRFLLDEHINRAIQRQLRRHDVTIEILAIGDPGAPEKGTLDPPLLDWIEENGYTLVTEDRNTMPEHWQITKAITIVGMKLWRLGRQREKRRRSRAENTRRKSPLSQRCPQKKISYI